MIDLLKDFGEQEMTKRISPLGQDLIGRQNSRFDIPTPALILDLDVLEQNIAIATQLANQKHIQLRPHCKGHKSINIAKLQMEAGAIEFLCWRS